MSSRWTEAKDAELKSRVETGASFAEIAAEMGITRSAVGGRAARLGLRSLNPPAPRKGQPKPRVERPKLARKPTPRRTILSEFRCVEIDPLHITLFELEKDVCRAPYGDEAPYTFCGRPTPEGLSYCVPHAALFFKVSDWPARRQGA